MKFALSAFLVVTVLASSLVAQDPLIEALAKQKHIVKLEDGKLTGKGAELLLKEAKSSQFFLIGESHGIAEMPILTTALFKQLNPHGYDYFAIETGPITARRIESFARKPSGFTYFNKKYPFALPFFNLKEEAKMIEDVLNMTNGAKSTLWGLDQEFAASPHFHIVRLNELAPECKFQGNNQTIF